MGFKPVSNPADAISSGSWAKRQEVDATPNNYRKPVTPVTHLHQKGVIWN